MAHELNKATEALAQSAAEQTNVAKMQTILNNKQKNINRWIAVFAFFSLIISVISILNYCSQQKNEMKPHVAILQEKADGKTKLILYNAGKGAAHNLNIEAHLTRYHRESDAYMGLEMIDAARKLTTKDLGVLSLFYRYGINAGGPWLRRLENPPAYLASGMNYSYSINTSMDAPMLFLFFTINYEDAAGNKYHSIWNGLKWESGPNTSQSLPNSYDGKDELGREGDDKGHAVLDSLYRNLNDEELKLNDKETISKSNNKYYLKRKENYKKDNNIMDEYTLGNELLLGKMWICRENHFYGKNAKLPLLSEKYNNECSQWTDFFNVRKQFM